MAFPRYEIHKLLIIRNHWLRSFERVQHDAGGGGRGRTFGPRKSACRSSASSHYNYSGRETGRATRGRYRNVGSRAGDRFGNENRRPPCGSPGRPGESCRKRRADCEARHDGFSTSGSASGSRVAAGSSSTGLGTELRERER